jgi:hypothetical protein
MSGHTLRHPKRRVSKVGPAVRTVATAFMSSTGADGIRGMSAPAAWLRGRYSEANQLYELVSNSPGSFSGRPYCEYGKHNSQHARDSTVITFRETRGVWPSRGSANDL